MVTTAEPTRTQETPSANWALAAAAGGVSAFAVIVAWAIHSGAIHRPYSDDWAYLRIAHRFLTGGTLDGVGWNDTSLIGQVLESRLIAPVAGSTVAGLRVLSIISAVVSLILAAVLARRARSRWLWPIVPLTLIGVPGFGSTVATYLTEQPALSVQLICLLLGLVAWQRWEQSGRVPVAYLVAVGAAGVWAGSIRQAAIAAPLAVLGAMLTHPRAGRAERRVILAVGTAVMLAVLVLAMITPLGGPTMAIVRGSISGQLARIYQAAATLALFLVPVAIVTGWFRSALRLVARWWSRPKGRAAVAGMGVVVVVGGVLLHRRTGSLLVGNSLQQTGGYPGMDLTFPKLFNAPTWSLVEFLAAGSLFLLAVLVLDALARFGQHVRAGGWRATATPLAATTPLTRVIAIWTALGMLAALGVNLAYRAIYDRYLVPVAIGLAILAIDNAVAPAIRSRRLTLATAALVPVLLLGLIAASDTQDLLDARWAGGDRLVALGYSAQQIDAGFDWVGYHYPGTARPDNVALVTKDYPPATYDAFFPAFVRCALVSPGLGAPAGYVLLDSVRHSRLFGLSSVTVYLFGSVGTTQCPPAGRG